MTRLPVIRGSCEAIRVYHSGSSTILPNCCPCSRRRCASAASASGNVRSITGLQLTGEKKLRRAQQFGLGAHVRPHQRVLAGEEEAQIDAARCNQWSRRTSRAGLLCAMHLRLRSHVASPTCSITTSTPRVVGETLDLGGNVLRVVIDRPRRRRSRALSRASRRCPRSRTRVRRAATRSESPPARHRCPPPSTSTSSPARTLRVSRACARR